MGHFDALSALSASLDPVKCVKLSILSGNNKSGVFRFVSAFAFHLIFLLKIDGSNYLLHLVL
jgi:hypothetical protein